ncbi:DUF572-domain-containing protein [Cryphonectria parasitica EP155]|uniref:DUF572-domain-containing protein n=1 Tax=Cryphonectria parasitica (strain ATCC 38755 / EP155) TaxID=660469 RepID=A0A9P5CKE9_CRYP1|nr:DUF572-domain-containing protein [Cryphonectria parasitica EP155]KAF3762003.1 DUF572-domain-containing protein [Cryphonectria parasitica EP155]
MQGFNMGRYVPPEHEGVLSANQASGKGYALGARASKLRTEGVITVRFEMPFAVWCDHCRPHPQIIGQGVRFNAEKKKIGNYYSSPIFSFRIRHAVCGGVIEVRTDPKNTAYVVVSGGRKRDTGEGKAADESLVGDGPLITPAEREEQRETAFSNLEKTIEDRAALERAKERIDEIGEVSARQWDDPYARNQALRKSFRVGRKAREKEAEAAEDIKERLGLGIELLPETEEDARRARLVEFGAAPDRDREESRAEGRVLAQPLFGGNQPRQTGTAAATTTASANASVPPRKLLKSERAASKMKQSLVSEIVGNTRLASDPFLGPRGRELTRSTPSIHGLKRKRNPAKEYSSSLEDRPAEKVAAVSSGLVDYDSD